MEQIAQPVSNLPLTCLSTPGKIENLKGCKFIPALYLNRNTYYFIVVTPRYPYIPVKGFYDCPDKGYITYVDGFKFVACSHPSEANYRCWVFEAFEGTPPHDWVPKTNTQGLTL